MQTDGQEGLSSSRELWVLLILAAALFSANMNTLSLPSLDDCFYARKGIETGRSDRFFTVTWDYHPAFQNPPLQFWLLGRSFSWFGENDFAARLPSFLMALGILLCIFRIGQLTVGANESITGIALLLLSPHFDINARRCMLEIPTALWIALCFLVWLEGFRRPRVHLLLALPLAAALLTKSLLGFLPLMVFVASLPFLPEARNAMRKPWIWFGTIVGIALGFSWPIHQNLTFGMEALRAHYFNEIVERSAHGLPLLNRIFGYPWILLGSFQIVVLPAIAGAVMLLKQRKALTIVIWCALPVLVYSLSSARSSRYLFPILPALALSGGYWLNTAFPRVARIVRQYVAPAILIAASLLIWIKPAWILHDENHEIKAQAETIRSRVPEDESLEFVGGNYWRRAGPLLYYAERFLQPAPSNQARFVFCERSRISEITGHFQIIAESGDWLLIQKL